VVRIFNRTKQQEPMPHFYRTIPGMFHFAGLYRRAVERAPDPAIFVEIGCHLGCSTAFLVVEALNSGKDITIYAVDLWDKESKWKAGPEDFLGYLGHMPNVVPLHMHSQEAVRQFADGSLDFIWIDGNHRYPGCWLDIRSWWHRLKSGGWMGGDDLNYHGVAKSVRLFFGEECVVDHPNGAWARYQETYLIEPTGLCRPDARRLCWWVRDKDDSWNPTGLHRKVRWQGNG